MWRLFERCNSMIKSLDHDSCLGRGAFDRLFEICSRALKLSIEMLNRLGEKVEALLEALRRDVEMAACFANGSVDMLLQSANGGVDMLPQFADGGVGVQAHLLPQFDRRSIAMLPQFASGGVDVLAQLLPQSSNRRVHMLPRLRRTPFDESLQLVIVHRPGSVPRRKIASTGRRTSPRRKSG